MTLIKRPAVAAVAIALGLALLLTGASLLMLRDGGWPWHASISDSAAAGSTTAEIIDEDGSAYRFTGSPADARRWLDREQDELKRAHGIPAKVAAGRVAQPAGLVLLLAGLARLFWLLVSARRARDTATPAGLPHASL